MWHLDQRGRPRRANGEIRFNAGAPGSPGRTCEIEHAGFRLCTLTNNTAEISGRQLERAGLLDAFERRFSVDDVRRHKPAPEVYASVARALQAQPSAICLVACHTWDTLGAVAAGWEAALVLRPGNALLDVGPQPQMTGVDLREVADKLIARYADRDRVVPV